MTLQVTVLAFGSNPICTARGVEVGTSDGRNKQQLPSVHKRFTKDSASHAIWIKAWLHTVFSCCVLTAVIVLLGEMGRRISTISSIGFPRWWTFFSKWHHWIWNVSVSNNCYADGTWHTTTWKTVGWLLNFVFCLFMARQWDMTDSFTFSDFSAFQTMAVSMTIMTQTMTDKI